MVVLILLLGFAGVILTGKLLAYQKELSHLHQQLELLEDGSHIELTSVSGSRNFLKVYRQLNLILSGHQKKEVEYSRAQNMLKQSISNIAHDIRTPLTGALGYLQILEEKSEEKEQIRYLSIVRIRMEELKQMLEELFLYTKLTNPEFTLECTRTPVFPALSSCMAAQYREFENRGIEPFVEFETEDVNVWANREALERIFGNLISNALMHGNGAIRIIQKEQTILFSNRLPEGCVLDTDSLFERFYKGDKSRKKGSSGLGLAIVKELTERMGGTVSARQKGETLEIALQFDVKRLSGS